MKMLKYLFLASMLLAGPASAQWQVPDHSVPIGNGGGVIGFNSAAPSTAGKPLLSNGASSDPSFQDLTGPANTVKCNPTTSTGVIQDCTGIIGVASTQTSNYTAQSADCGGRIYLGGNTQFALTVNAANTYPLGCHFSIQNIDGYTGVGTGRGKQMLINGITTHFLYPGQKLDIDTNVAGTAWVPRQPLSGADGQVWFVPSNNVFFFMDTGGSDTNNDGLASGASGSFASPQGCVGAVYARIYMRKLESQAFCSGTAGQTFSPGTMVTAFFQLPNSSLTINSTSPGTRWTWNCPVGLPCLQVGDNFLGQTADISMVGSSTTAVIIAGHQFSILDAVNLEMVGNSSSTNGFDCDSDTHYNISGGYHYKGTFNLLINGCQGSSIQVSNAFATSGTATVSRPYNLTTGAKMTFAGNVAFDNTGLTTSVGLVQSNSTLNNFAGSGTIPGGAPTPTSGGIYCTANPCP